jgi:RimJ/RimL family protein N-acetyltransferase
LALILREVRADDYPQAYALACGQSTSIWGRFHQFTPSIEDFRLHFWKDVQLQQAVVDTDGRFVGSLAIYGYHSDGFAFLNIATDPKRGLEMLPLLGVFIEFAFGRLPIRKLYGEMTDCSFSRLKGMAGQCFEVESILRKHSFHNGAYVDVYQLAIHRSEHLAAIVAVANSVKARRNGSDPLSFEFEGRHVSVDSSSRRPG